MRQSPRLIVAPFGNGWCVRFDGASTPSVMTETEAESRAWALAYAREHEMQVVQVRDRRDRVIEEITVEQS
jgi:hypothetical protein